MPKPPYEFYEGVMNAVVGAVYVSAKMKRLDVKQLVMVALEKFFINRLSSLGSDSICTATTTGERLDIEYLAGAVLAGLYHSGRAFDAAGEQLVISIIAHLISSMITRGLLKP